MIVTKLTAQKKTPDRVNVFIDGVYQLSLTLDQVLESKLRVGMEIDAPMLKSLEKLSAEGKLRAKTLEWLVIRPRSRRELLHYLHRKGVDAEVSEAWADFFAKMRYQDDRHFAAWWVAQRRTGKQRSSQFIRAELRAKGISRELIDEALAEQEMTDVDTLRQLIAKKRHMARYQDEKKLIAYLQRQGYRYLDILDALAGGE